MVGEEPSIPVRNGGADAAFGGDDWLWYDI